MGYVHYFHVPTFYEGINYTINDNDNDTDQWVNQLTYKSNVVPNILDASIFFVV